MVCEQLELLFFFDKHTLNHPSLIPSLHSVLSSTHANEAWERDLATADSQSAAVKLGKES